MSSSSNKPDPVQQAQDRFLQDIQQRTFVGGDKVFDQSFIVSPSPPAAAPASSPVSPSPIQPATNQTTTSKP